MSVHIRDFERVVFSTGAGISAEINPERTEMSELYDSVLRGSASEMLAQLAA